MPLFEYKCKQCGKVFEELVKNSAQQAFCPDCKGEGERVYSGKMYSATGKTASSCTGDCKHCSGCHHS